MDNAAKAERACRVGSMEGPVYTVGFDVAFGAPPTCSNDTVDKKEIMGIAFVENRRYYLEEEDSTKYMTLCNSSHLRESKRKVIMSIFGGRTKMLCSYTFCSKVRT